MEYRKKRKVVPGAACVLLSCILGGCSLSFGGFSPGGGEELTFWCAEGLPEADAAEAGQPKLAGEVDAVSAGQPGEVGAAKAGQPKTAGEAGKIDLNTAGLAELMALNGIGESRAQAILEYRKQNGAFMEIEDIMQVPGIKEGIFSRIKEQITVH